LPLLLRRMDLSDLPLTNEPQPPSPTTHGSGGFQPAATFAVAAAAATKLADKCAAAAADETASAASWLPAAAELWTQRALRRARPGAAQLLTVASLKREVKNWEKKKKVDKLGSGVSADAYVTNVVRLLQESPLFVCTNGAFLLTAEGKVAMAALVEQLQLGAPNTHTQPAGAAPASELLATAEDAASSAHLNTASSSVQTSLEASASCNAVVVPWLPAAVELWTRRALRRARPGSKPLSLVAMIGEVMRNWKKDKLPEGIPERLTAKKYLRPVVRRLKKSPLFMFTDGSILLTAKGDEALQQLLLQESSNEQQSCVEPHATADDGPVSAALIHPPPPAELAASVGQAVMGVGPRAALNPDSPSPLQLGSLEIMLLGIMPTAESVQGRAAALAMLQSSILTAHGKGSTKLQGALLTAYGSTVCGFDIEGSDLDFALQPAAEIRTNGKRSWLLGSFMKAMLADAQLSSCLAAPLTHVTDARVPVLRVELLQPHGEVLHVDVTESTGRNTFKSAVLGIVADALPILRPLVRLVKAWARAWELNCAFTGGLNSFALSLLCVFHCQCAGLLPPLAALLCDDPVPLMKEEAARAATGSKAGPLRRSCDQLANEATVRTRAKSAPLWQHLNVPPAQLFPLLLSFFEWWQSATPRMSSGECVQPLTGQWASATPFRAITRRQTHLAVEDPFDAAENAARNLIRNSPMALRLSAAIADALAKLRAGCVDKLLNPPTTVLLPVLELENPLAATSQLAHGLASRGTSPMEDTGATAEDGEVDDHARFLLPLPWPPGGAATLDVRVPRPAGVSAALTWLSENPLMHEPAVLMGMDVESDNFDDTALIQFSTANRCVLVRLSARTAHDATASTAMCALCTLLNDPHILKVGCELRADAVALLHDTGLRARLRNGLDVSPALRRPGAAGARGHVFGLVDAFNMRHPAAKVVKDKESTFSDWGAETLSDAQLRYAALDAWMSYRLGRDTHLVQNPLAVRVDLGGDLAELADAGMLARRPRRTLPSHVSS
jgi:hypothetical protein